MKLEMAESLLLSWLKHVKGCQIAQTNWKGSPRWELAKRDELTSLMEYSSNVCREKFGYDIYKKNAGIDQLLTQAEIDVLGINISSSKMYIYAIDVAFHESGLNYGSNDETVSRIIKKIFRSVMCLYGYFDNFAGEVIFASPKIHNKIYNKLCLSVEIVEEVLRKKNIFYKIRLIGNDDFYNEVMKPVINVSNDIMDTADLFMRSIQMYNIFINEKKKECIQELNMVTIEKEDYSKLTVGKIAQGKLREVLENGILSEEELLLLQEKEYSKQCFNVNFPLLRPAREGESRPLRYYKNTLMIRDKQYFLTSEWYENSRRPLLLWIDMHDR